MISPDLQKLNEITKSFHWLYQSKIIKFLMTVTIKSESMVYYYNRIYNELDIDEQDPSTFPYYINLSGKYHDLNTLMDTGNEFSTKYIISKESFNDYPFLRDFYLQDYDALLRLFNRYENQHVLLRGILYNHSYSLEELIRLPNFSLVGCSLEVLDPQERDIILIKLNDFLRYYNYRWYINTFLYEELYGLACESVLWSILPIVILYFKIQNIKTSYADDFNIWEYLISKGMDDFRDHFTYDQTMFFYKNINYLIANKGKIKTLDIINNVLLKPLGVDLYSLYNSHKLKTLDKNPDSWDNTITYKELNEYNKENITHITNYKDFQLLLHENELDPHEVTDIYISSFKEKFRLTPFNEHLTKFQKLNVFSKKDYKYYQNYLNYVFDNFVYLLSLDKISFYIPLESVFSSNKRIYLHSKDIIPLFYYFIYKYNEITPEVFPKVHTLKYAFTSTSKHEMKSVLDESISFNGIEFLISDILEIDDLISYCQIPSESDIHSSISFRNYINLNYKTLFLPLLLNQRKGKERFFSIASNKAFISFHKQFTIDLTDFLGEITYEEWFDTNVNIKMFVDTIDKLKDKYGNYVYLNIIVQIFENLCGLDSSIRKRFYVTKTEKEYYRKILNLVESFNSYLVRLIKTDLVTYKYLFSSFKSISIGFGKVKAHSHLIYPSKGIIFKHQP